MNYTERTLEKTLKGLYEVINLLKDIKKQNDTIIKQLRSINNGVAEANGYILEDGEDD